MAEGHKIDPDKTDTVCTECYFVFEGKYVRTCSYCHGRVEWVRKGTGQRYAQMIKQRGRGHTIT